MEEKKRTNSMTQQEIEQHLQSALAAVTPDIWAKLDLCTPQDSQSETMVNGANRTIHVLDGKKGHRAEKMVKLQKRLRNWGAVAACVCLVVLGGTYYYEYVQVASIIGIDINPSLVLSLNRRERVVKAEALNQDGQELMDSRLLKGKRLDAAVDQVVNSLVEKGYLKENQKTQAVLLSVSGKDQEAAEKLKTTVTANMESAISQKQVNAVVYDQTIQVTEELEELAQSYQVSVGKAEFVGRLIEENQELSQGKEQAYEEMINQPMEELAQEIDKNSYYVSSRVTIIQASPLEENVRERNAHRDSSQERKEEREEQEKKRESQAEEEPEIEEKSETEEERESVLQETKEERKEEIREGNEKEQEEETKEERKEEAKKQKKEETKEEKKAETKDKNKEETENNASKSSGSDLEESQEETLKEIKKETIKEVGKETKEIIEEKTEEKESLEKETKEEELIDETEEEKKEDSESFKESLTSREEKESLEDTSKENPQLQEELTTEEETTEELAEEDKNKEKETASRETESSKEAGEETESSKIYADADPEEKETAEEGTKEIIESTIKETDKEKETVEDVNKLDNLVKKESEESLEEDSLEFDEEISKEEISKESIENLEESSSEKESDQENPEEEIPEEETETEGEVESEEKEVKEEYIEEETEQEDESHPSEEESKQEEAEDLSEEEENEEENEEKRKKTVSQVIRMHGIEVYGDEPGDNTSERKIGTQITSSGTQIIFEPIEKKEWKEQVPMYASQFLSGSNRKLLQKGPGVFEWSIEELEDEDGELMYGPGFADLFTNP